MIVRTYFVFFFFFFQAEDGIRDVAVTGVQTCALPIFSPKPAEIRPDPRSRSESPPPTANPVIPPAHRKPCARPPLSVRRASLSRSAATPPASPAAPNSRRQRTARNLRRQKEIGRAHV